MACSRVSLSPSQQLLGPWLPEAAEYWLLTYESLAHPVQSLLNGEEPKKNEDPGVNESRQDVRTVFQQQ